MADQPDLIPEGELEIHQFAGMDIRRVLHNDEWFFSVLDIVQAVTESAHPGTYWAKVKSQILAEQPDTQTLQIWEELKLPSMDGKLRGTDCATVENIFRIIQSLPGKKSEPFKRWLAKVGYERIQEIQNPEIAVKRAIFYWQIQGRDHDWIDARLKTIISRKELTDEWHKRGIEEGLQYAVLTDEISKGTFDLTTKEHKSVKNLGKNHNLRDHMSPTELVLTMLGETATKQIAKSRNAVGFNQNKLVAAAGGQIAGDARRNLEKELGAPIVSSQNFLKHQAPENPILALKPSHKEACEKMNPKKK